MGRRPTLATVAARAGVAPSTASLVFSGGGPVAEATRARVLAAADEIGYTGPDPRARSLRQGRSGIVAVLIGGRMLQTFRDPVQLALMDGISQEVGPLGYGLLVLPGDAEHREPGIEQVARMQMDAAVYATCGRDDDPVIERLRVRDVPTLAVEGPVDPRIPLVTIANREGAAAAARHVRDLGHRRVAAMTLPLRADGHAGPPGERLAHVSYVTVRDRIDGVRDVYGPDVPVIETPGNLVEEGARATDHLLDGPSPPTAILAQADLLAAGAVQAAERRGLQVPRDLSVVGFDGLDLPWFTGHRLTTIAQPLEDKSRTVGHHVAELLAGRHPADVTFPVTLQQGTTTGPPPRP